MALISCPECGASISDQAASCPKCGFPFRKNAATAPETKASGENIAPNPVRTIKKNNDLSIDGMICTFLLPILGLILSILARKKAIKNGDKTSLATAGIWISAILLALSGIYGLIYLIAE